jgi:hypothetical protein
MNSRRGHRDGVDRDTDAVLAIARCASSTMANTPDVEGGLLS